MGSGFAGDFLVVFLWIRRVLFIFRCACVHGNAAGVLGLRAFLQLAVVNQPYFAKANSQGDAIISPASP